MIRTRDGFNAAINKLSFGKRLPSAVYVIRTDQLNTHPELCAAIRRAKIAARPPETWNLLKLHTKEFAITFLTYPDFDKVPHPALAAATKINLNTGSVTRTDFHQRANPPILHRKETFLPPGDHRTLVYAALTRREEEAGLYRDPSRIGLHIQWQTLLKQLGLAYEGPPLASERETLSVSALENRTMPAVAHPFRNHEISHKPPVAGFPQVSTLRFHSGLLKQKTAVPNEHSGHVEWQSNSELHQVERLDRFDKGGIISDVSLLCGERKLNYT